MELRHLKYFQAVAEELSFSRAAKRLHIAQPALSRSMQQLESEMGVTLIDRSRRAIQLTASGEVLLRDCLVLFERVDDTVRRVRHAASGGTGELRLGYIGPPTKLFLAPLLRQFRESNPGVIVSLEERTPERVWEMVAKGRLSIGLTRPVLAHEALGLESLELFEETLCAAVPAHHPFAEKDSVSWGDLADRPLILLARREGAGSHDAILAACRRAGFAPRIVHTPSVIGTILRYVEFGDGVGVVPESITPESDEVCLVPLTPRATIPLVMVWSSDQNNPAVEAFCGLVRDWLMNQKLLAKKGG
ncbi:MAG: LysR family transcriptional regulator [Verrucomicrobiales bacterium]|nr:LysR family transcriptional regulator [Verrucomicrobiales bacterium]